jgi:hypothetical protein
MPISPRFRPEQATQPEKIFPHEISPKAKMPLPLRVARQLRGIRVGELAIEKALYPGSESIETSALRRHHWAEADASISARVPVRRDGDLAVSVRPLVSEKRPHGELAVAVNREH